MDRHLRWPCRALSPHPAGTDTGRLRGQGRFACDHLVVNGKPNGSVADTAGLVDAHGAAGPNPATVTLTDSLGSSVTVPVTVVKRK
jgi:hypothetical protein